MDGRNEVRENAEEGGSEQVAGEREQAAGEHGGKGDSGGKFETEVINRRRRKPKPGKHGT